ncbi:AI-2E family transporter [Arcticibacter tournemirensis]|uniref:AI-2E family transporter n=1 Tax=Arcticibacter tournemirensis TaxID=699437 RepID=A0A4V1KIF1_9SPHI|nr:AI-2E family transporter [Arcticibacter tournemirensis]RXF70472.1 AI-2E family transporter [Arcticibacter tournemirensis]
MDENNSKHEHSSGGKNLKVYTQKVWITLGIIALLVILIFILKAAFNVLLMVFAGSLIATYFHGVADIIETRTQLRRRWCVMLSVSLSFIVAGLLFWFLGAKISEQVGDMSKELPDLVKTAEEKLKQSSLGRKIIYYISGNNSQKLMTSFQQIFRTSFGIVGDFYITFFIGVFFTANPNLYKDGIIKLIPPAGKATAKRLMDRISYTLKGWLKGMLIAMFFISILTLTGLTIIGVPMGLALAVMAGLLNFIPNFGPLIAMIPAVLIGLTVSVNTTLIIVALYLLIQAVESNIVTPMVQNAMIKIPPAMIIISQVLFGTLTGGLGIILATPLLAVIIVTVDELYVKKLQNNNQS